jgi:hypothetical protein
MPVVSAMSRVRGVRVLVTHVSCVVRVGLNVLRLLRGWVVMPVLVVVGLAHPILVAWILPTSMRECFARCTRADWQ